MSRENPLVSIIIPTYNRAHLIGETLDSVLAQTYQNWECIVVDDGSTDNTDELMGKYMAKDARFQYHHRPNDRLPGGNAARNYGFELSRGNYVIWFDSDDLMTADHIETKFKLIKSGNFDFAITRTEFFNLSQTRNDSRFDFSDQDINLDNFITQRINWFTLDVILKSETAETISYNESLLSGQEFNYFSKLLFHTDKGTYLNKVVSLARHHDDSISTTINTGVARNRSRALTKWTSFQDTKSKLCKRSKKRVLLDVYKEMINSKKSFDNFAFNRFWIQIALNYKFQSFYMFLYIIANKYTNRFHFLRKLALKSSS